jgi:hypothetical protein
VTLVTIAFAAGYVGIAAFHGALGIPRNDDWTYYRAAFQFARDGYFAPDPYTSTMLIGQTLAAQPLVSLFGANLAAFQVSTAALSAIALLATYAVVRRFLSPAWAGFSVACLALGPIYGGISATFMTDVPSFALQAVSLWAGARALERMSLPWLFASFLVGIGAFSIREYGVAAPLAVALAYGFRIAREPWRRRAAFWIACVGFLLIVVGLYVWRAEARGAAVAARTIHLKPDRWDLVRVTQLGFTLALLAGPALVVLRPRAFMDAWSRQKVVSCVAIASVLVAWASVRGRHGVFLGNYITPSGSYSETLPGQAPQVIPNWGWQALELAALAGAAALAFLAIDAIRGGLLRRPASGLAVGEPKATSAALSLIYVLLVVALAGAAGVFASAPMFDRYLFPAVPFLTAVVVYAAHLKGVSRGQAVRAAVALGAVAVVGFAVVDASATLDGAKWRASQRVRQIGYQAAVIDGGLEWFAYHQPSPIVPIHAPAAGQNFWVGLFQNPTVCVVLRLPERGAHECPSLVATSTARSLFGAEYVIEACRTGRCGGSPRRRKACRRLAGRRRWVRASAPPDPEPAPQRNPASARAWPL